MGHARLGHVGLNVSDLDAAVELFCSCLDFEVTWQSTISDSGGSGMARWLGLPAAAHARFAFLQSPDADVAVELMQWADATGEPPPALNGSGGRHVAVWVADPARTADALAQRGCHLFETHPTGFVYAVTPWGLHLQLMPQSPAQESSPR